MIAPEAPLTVTLQAQQWNIILGALGEAPWRLADPVIRAVMQQTQSAVDDAAPLPPKPNGLDGDAASAH